MNINFGLTDYGRMTYMLRMADQLKIKKRLEILVKDDPSSSAKYQKKIEEVEKKMKDILKQMEEYAKKNKTQGVVAYA